jgi:hypothetical protein
MSNSQIKMASWRKVSGIGLPTCRPPKRRLRAGLPALQPGFHR